MPPASCASTTEREAGDLARRDDGTPGSATTFNRDARVFGGEVEEHVRPAAGLEIGFLGSYLDATLKRVNLPSGGAIVDTRGPLAPNGR